jgi:hypothetical protein
MHSTPEPENTTYLRCVANIVAGELNRKYPLVAAVGELSELAPMLMATATSAARLITLSLATPRTI